MGLLMKKFLLIFVILTASFYSCVSVAYTGESPSNFKTIHKVDPRLRYIHKTVREPLMDEARLDVPDSLNKNKFAHLGLVDVTAAPFYADPSGMKDSTRAIQEAINLARDYQMVCYFPLGTYKVSETLSCIQGYYQRQNGKIGSSRNFFCSLMGSRTVPGKRPKIFLAPDSYGFNNPNKPKYVLHYWTRSHKRGVNKHQPNIAYNQKFTNIDIEIGDGNSGAIGIRLRGAEGSGISDSTIDVTHGLTGVSGGSGSGGSHANVTVIGGKIGMDLRETQPTPVLVGITLIGQTETALIYGGRQTLSAVGLKIITKTQGPVIKIEPMHKVFFNGPICIIDSEINFESQHKKNIVISTNNRSTYFNNIYVKNANRIFEYSDGSEIKANPVGWIRIKEYAGRIKPNKWKRMQYDHKIYINGTITQNNISEYEFDKEPPANLRTKHFWDINFPFWDSIGSVNVKAPPYNAKGDGFSDDTLALQRAINDNEIVFFPKGFYRVKRTIKLKLNSKLVGIDPRFSTIMIRDKEGFFEDSKNPKPLIETANVKDAETILNCIGIYIPLEVPGAYALKWQCGGASILRATKPRLHSFVGFGKKFNWSLREKPLSIITENGGGKWFNQFGEFPVKSPDYRHILVDHAIGPLSFYMLQSQYAISDATCEIRNSEQINIFGLKGEGSAPIIRVENSNHIRIFGYGGNGAPLGDHSIFELRNVDNFLIANALDCPRLETKNFAPIVGPGRDPTEWHIITEATKDGRVIKTAPLERPVLYKRGVPIVE